MCAPSRSTMVSLGFPMHFFLPKQPPNYEPYPNPQVNRAVTNGSSRPAVSHLLGSIIPLLRVIMTCYQYQLDQLSLIHKQYMLTSQCRHNDVAPVSALLDKCDRSGVHAWIEACLLLRDTSTTEHGTPPLAPSQIVFYCGRYSVLTHHRYSVLSPHRLSVLTHHRYSALTHPRNFVFIYFRCSVITSVGTP